MEALLDTLLATVDSGDEVVVTDPTYAGFVNRVRIAGATPRFAPFGRDGDGWALDVERLEAAIGPETACLPLMSPSMPPGGTFGEDDRRAVCPPCPAPALPPVSNS